MREKEAECKRQTFYTWGEYLKFAMDAPNETEYDSSRKTGGYYGKGWSGTDTWEEALKLAIDGWHDGECKANGVAAPILDKLSSLVERQEIVYDVEGMGLDVAAYLKGEPECWQKIETHTVDGTGTRQLRVVYNSAASCGVSAEVLNAKGATVAALVQLLEFAGNRVELWDLAMCSGGWDRKKPVYEARVLVKAADQELDMGRVIFALAHPANMRRLGFSVQERNKEQAESLGSGYGCPVETLDDKESRGDIYIGSSYYGEPQWTDTKQATDWVVKTLKEQGVKMLD
jgi:hypothetical protein